MNWTALGRGARSDAGNALVELAVALPVLVLALLGTADYARVFYTSIALTNAARAGAQYGAANLAASNLLVNMETTATSSINITGVTAAASRLCQCFDNAGALTGAGTVSCTAATPCGSDHRVMTVTVTAQKTFTTAVNYIGLPSSIPLTRSATLRVSE